MDSCYSVTVFNDGRFLMRTIAENAAAVDALRDAFAEEPWIAIIAHPIYTNARVRRDAYGWRFLIELVGVAEWGDDYNKEEYGL